MKILTTLHDGNVHIVKNTMKISLRNMKWKAMKLIALFARKLLKLKNQNKMNFILWTLVWWGLNESMWWRIYKHRDEKYIKESPWTVIFQFLITWILYIYLYNEFIK